MTNIHRLRPLPKVRRHGVVRCEISDEINIRELAAALATAGLVLTHHTVLRIERRRESK